MKNLILTFAFLFSFGACASLERDDSSSVPPDGAPPTVVSPPDASVPTPPDAPSCPLPPPPPPPECSCSDDCGDGSVCHSGKCYDTCHCDADCSDHDRCRHSHGNPECDHGFCRRD